MSGYLRNVYSVLAIAFVLANVCIWCSLAQDELKGVKFTNEDEKELPHTVLARRTPGEDSIVFLNYDHHIKDQQEEKHANESLSVQTDRFGSDDLDQVDRKGAVVPKPASCKPELVTVPLHNSDDKSVLYYPSCTRVERCGGCCSHDLLSCQPTATELLNYQVIVTKFEGGTKLTFKGKEIVTVEQHTKCKCDCRVKETDCNSLQEYNKAECRCICMNVDEEQKCILENDTKLWDPSECRCACRQTKECSTGYYFDQKTCG
ncbi:hypothetical protein C0J52_07155 [Blattella germanica]|nr:hypothetical protein C0J52_07155 [Blattella germanica]